MAEYRFWRRRECKNMKNQKAVIHKCKQNIVSRGGDAAVAEGRRQIKIVVSKEELKQVLQAIQARRGPPSFEQRLNFLRRRHILRSAAELKPRNRSGSWIPVLQTIPEEM